MNTNLKAFKIIKAASQLLLVLSAFFAGFTLYRAGVIVDEYGTLLQKYSWPMYSLWGALLVPLISLAIVHELYSNGILQKLFSGVHPKVYYAVNILCLVVIAFSCYAGIDANIELNNTVSSRAEPQSFKTDPRVLMLISLEKLEELMTTGQTEVVYVTRQGCPACSAFQPELESLLKDKKIRALYYDTTDDRETRLDYLKEVLKKYGITSVPSVVILSDGIVAHNYNGDNSLSDLKDYFDSIS